MQVDFIIGIPRSGTTLLSTRLATIPHTLALLETRITIEIIKDFTEQDNQFTRTKAYLTFIKTKIEKTDYSLVDDPVRLIDQKQPTSPEETWGCIAACIRGVHPSTPKRIVDKNPNFTWHAPKIADAFPNSRFIVTNRDPRGFILSKQQKRNKTNYIVHTSFLCYLWKDFQKEMQRFTVLHPEKTMDVLYEDLSQSPTKVLQNVCAFLELPYHSELIRGYAIKLDTSKRKDDSKQKDLERDINKSRAFAWKERLPPHQKLRIEVLCSKEMDRLGFEKEFSPGPLKKNWIRLSASPYWLLSVLRKQIVRRKF